MLSEDDELTGLEAERFDESVADGLSEFSVRECVSAKRLTVDDSALVEVTDGVLVFDGDRACDCEGPGETVTAIDDERVAGSLIVEDEEVDGCRDTANVAD